MGYQFFLPMVLRWRASRAEAPLQTQVGIVHKYRQPNEIIDFFTIALHLLEIKKKVFV